MSKCNLIHLWWGGKFHWKLPPAVTLHSGLPKRPITKYYLHNLLLHNLPLRQSYFPLLSRSFYLQESNFEMEKKIPQQKLTTRKSISFQKRRETEQRRKFQMTFNLMPIRLLLYYTTTIWLQFKPRCYCHAAQFCCYYCYLAGYSTVWNNMVR